LASVHRQPLPHFHRPPAHTYTQRENLKILIACFDTKWRCKNELELMMRHANPDEAEDGGRRIAQWFGKRGALSPAGGAGGPGAQIAVRPGRWTLLCVGCAGCKCAF